ncbi:pro-epidermal growth factor-like [Ptychodera flava]|uniref:pro-epidermal growth factor-like n=1 Tax=Ptychodera flava TaxID=63121 RepID=UPI00396A274F
MEDYIRVLPANAAHQMIPQYDQLSDVSVDELALYIKGLYLFAVVRLSKVTEIRRKSLGAPSKWENIITLHSSDIQGIAVDWIGSNLYIAEAEKSEILISTLDGAFLTTLIDNDLNNPAAIAVHAPKEYLFWSDTGPNPRIERSDLTGRERRVIVNSDIESPTHLVIDFKSDRIYWADGGTRLIQSADLDGRRDEIFYDFSNSTVEHFYFTGIAIFQDLLFVATVENSLSVFDMNDKSLIKSLNPPSKIVAMTFFHESLQPAAEGPCGDFNDCDEICINTKNGVECLCSQPSCTTGEPDAEGNTVIIAVSVIAPVVTLIIVVALSVIVRRMVLKKREDSDTSTRQNNIVVYGKPDRNALSVRPSAPPEQKVVGVKIPKEERLSSAAVEVCAPSTDPSQVYNLKPFDAKYNVHPANKVAVGVENTDFDDSDSDSMHDYEHLTGSDYCALECSVSEDYIKPIQ